MYQKGFTLIELLVVIAIMGILAGFVLTTLDNQTQKATVAKGKEFYSQVEAVVGFSTVGKWNFNEASGNALDSSGYENDGTLNGGVTRLTESSCDLGFDGCLSDR